MASPLSGSLAKTVGKAFKGLFLDATLTRETPGTGPAYDPGPSTTVEYVCKAIHDQWSSFDIANSLVEASERKILILATSLAVEPASGDKITIRGETFTISGSASGKPAVATDPAKAVFVMRAST